MSEQRIALHSRKKTNRKYWYAQFKDEETGLYGTAKSIDVLSRKLGDKPHHISKSDEAYRVTNL